MKEHKVFNKFRLANDMEDFAQECNAYMKIKLFMSNRIVELENTVENLTDKLSIQVTKNSQLLEWIQNLNMTLNDMKLYNFQNLDSNLKEKENDDKIINLSGSFNDSLLLVDSNNLDKQFMNITNSPKHFYKDNYINENKRNDNKTNNIQEYENRLTELKNENLELIKENQLHKIGLMRKNLKINKLITEKLIMINELTELLNSLGRVNKNALQKFFRENTNNSNLNEKDVTSSLGIKYNILSAYSHLGMISFKKEIFDDSKIFEEDKEFLKIDKLKSTLKVYEEEFERLINRNLKKKKIIHFSDSE